jgi:bacterioferritin-associated ferredoxin
VPRRSFVCRCEDVSLSEVEHAIAEGLTDLEEIKRYTGLGTGPCQGKECMGPMTRWLIDHGHLEPSQARPFTARPPTEPVPFEALATAPEALVTRLPGRTRSEDP